MVPFSDALGSTLPVWFAHVQVLWVLWLVVPSSCLLLSTVLRWLQPPYLGMSENHTHFMINARATCSHHCWLGLDEREFTKPCSLTAKQDRSKVQFMLQSSLWDQVEARFHLKVSSLCSFCLTSVLFSYSFIDFFWEHCLNKSLGHKSLSQSLLLGNLT